MLSKTDKLRAIRDKVVGLKESPLYKYRKENGYHAVLGEGNHDARIVFIGEAPGKNEAEQGRPFCGAAGRILDELLISIGLTRQDVYVTNIVKDRPPENRDPTTEEIELYSPSLFDQINIIEPRVIATLGRFSTKYILEKFNSIEKDRTISDLHGKVIDVKLKYGDVKITPLYHPAVALYNSNTKETLKKDFQMLRELVKTV